MYLLGLQVIGYTPITQQQPIILANYKIGNQDDKAKLEHNACTVTSG